LNSSGLSGADHETNADDISKNGMYVTELNFVRLESTKAPHPIASTTRVRGLSDDHDVLSAIESNYAFRYCPQFARKNGDRRLPFWKRPVLGSKAITFQSLTTM